MRSGFERNESATRSQRLNLGMTIQGGDGARGGTSHSGGLGDVPDFGMGLFMRQAPPEAIPIR